MRSLYRYSTHRIEYMRHERRSRQPNHEFVWFLEGELIGVMIFADFAFAANFTIRHCVYEPAMVASKEQSGITCTFAPSISERLLWRKTDPGYTEFTLTDRFGIRETERRIAVPSIIYP